MKSQRSILFFHKSSSCGRRQCPCTYECLLYINNDATVIAFKYMFPFTQFDATQSDDLGHFLPKLFLLNRVRRTKKKRFKTQFESSFPIVVSMFLWLCSYTYFVEFARKSSPLDIYILFVLRCEAKNTMFVYPFPLYCSLCHEYDLERKDEISVEFFGCIVT